MDIIEGYAVVENGKIVKTTNYWIYPEKEDAERMLWNKGVKETRLELVKVYILQPKKTE